MTVQVREIKETLQSVRNKIRCVRSDMERDATYVVANHVKHRRELVRRLTTLRDRYYGREALVTECEARIAHYKRELGKMKDRPRILRMLALVKKINKLDKKHPVQLRKALTRAYASNERWTTLVSFVRAYENEIELLGKLPVTFEAQELVLTNAIDLEDRRFEEFLLHRQDGDRVIDELLERASTLTATVEHVPDLRKIERLQREIAHLSAEVTPEQEAIVQDELDETQIDETGLDDVPEDVRADMIEADEEESEVSSDGEY